MTLLEAKTEAQNIAARIDETIVVYANGNGVYFFAAEGSEKARELFDAGLSMVFVAHKPSNDNK